MSKMALTSCMVMLVFMAGCSDEDRQESPAADEDRQVSSQVQEVLETYRQAVWTEVLPKLEKMDGNKTGEFIQQEVARLANQYLAPHKELLAKEAGCILANLPKADPIDRSKWEPRYPDMVEESCRGNIVSFGFLANAERGLLFVHLWNPVGATGFYRKMVQVNVMGMTSYGRISMLDGCAPPMKTVVDADPDHPILVVKTGNELWIVSLQRADDGIYELKKIEWLKRETVKKVALTG